MGRIGRGASSGAIVPVGVNAANGDVRYDAIVTAQHAGKVVHTQFADLKEKRPEDAIQLRPGPDAEAAAAARTRPALESIVASKVSYASSAPPTASSRAADAKFIRYTPAEDSAGYNPATKQRVIQLVEAPVDPLEPPKFKHKKLPGGPPDAPVPVMHSPPRKVTVADQAAWKIPSAISNWKNARGFVVPLDKRLASDGRTLLEPTMNDNFARLSEALLLAERKARSEVEMRAAVAKKLAAKDKDAKEAELRALAARARMERAGIADIASGVAAGAGAIERGVGAAAVAGAGRGGDEAREAADDERQAYAVPMGRGYDMGRGTQYGRDGAAGAAAEVADDAVAEAEERDRLRAERKRERERDLRVEAGGKKSKTTRDEDRDVSERIALGMAVGRGGAAAGGEALYDSRLFNQTEGISSGHAAEDGASRAARYAVHRTYAAVHCARSHTTHLFALQNTTSTRSRGGATPRRRYTGREVAVRRMSTPQRPLLTRPCRSCKTRLASAPTLTSRASTAVLPRPEVPGPSSSSAVQLSRCQDLPRPRILSALMRFLRPMSVVAAAPVPLTASVAGLAVGALWLLSEVVSVVLPKNMLADQVVTASPSDLRRLQAGRLAGDA